MKIALINPLMFQEKLIKRNEVLSLMYLKQFLKEREYTADIIELEMEDENDLDMQDLSWVHQYDMIGISCYYPFNPLQLSNKIKAVNEKVLIFAGGPMASLLYRELLFDKSPISAVIVNEGEYSLFELVKKYDLEKNITAIDGVAIIQAGEVVYNRRLFEENLDNFSYPEREEGYFEKFIPTIISSRGCNGRCAFCSTRYTGNWRGRSPENVYLEIEDIVLRHKQTHFQFVEPNFLQDGHRAEQIAELLEGLPYKVTFDFACRIDSIVHNKIVIAKLKKVGAIKALLGVENFSDNILGKWGKDITCSQIEDAIRILRSNSLAFSVSLILFYPEVTIEELVFNVKEIEELDIIYEIENLFNALILIPGTKMNMTTQKKEWQYKEPQISYIHKACMEYRQQLSKLSKDFNLEMVDYKELFEINAFLKRYEFDKLKELLNLPVQKKQITNEDVFIINPQIVFQMQGKTGECINEEMGVVFQVDQTLIEVLNYIKDKNIFWIINDLEEIGEEYKNEKSKVVERICFLLKNRLVLVGGDKQW